MKSRLWRLGLCVLGIAMLVTTGILLEEYAGIPFAITYRLACTGACMWLLIGFASDYPGERWPWIATAMTALVDVGLIVTVLRPLPASKGDLILVSLPAAIIFLFARIVNYDAPDLHRRAVRQQMILALVLAIAFAGIFFGLVVMIPAKGR